MSSMTGTIKSGRAAKKKARKPERIIRDNDRSTAILPPSVSTTLKYVCRESAAYIDLRPEIADYAQTVSTPSYCSIKESSVAIFKPADSACAMIIRSKGSL